MELLKEEGLILERARNGVECVEMLEKSVPGYYVLILMDIQMPVMDGYHATQSFCLNICKTGKKIVEILAGEALWTK